MEGYSWIFLVLVLSQGADAFPNGAPLGRCPDAYPHHGPRNEFGLFTGMWYSQPVDESPYEITVDSQTNTYTSGQEFIVTIKGNAENVGKEFKGFVLRARRTSGDTDELLGGFSNVPPDTREFIYGSSSTTNCLTHMSNATKPGITVKWTAPTINVGDIVLGGTVVEQMDTFYVDILITLTPTGFSTLPVLGPDYEPEDTFSDFTFTGCGSEYGCLKTPGSCGVTNCDTIVSWRPDPDNDDNMYFELRSEIPTHDTGYVALGWSTDKIMGLDDTVTCTFSADGQQGNVQYGLNAAGGPYKYNDRTRTEGFSKMRLKREDGVLYCSFSRPAEGGGLTFNIQEQEEQTFTVNLKTTDYHLLVAVGPAYSFDSPNKHDVPPKSSNLKWNFSTNKEYQAFTGETITNRPSSAGNRNVALVAVILMGLAMVFNVN